MNKHPFLPLNWENWDGDGQEYIIFYDVEFTEDFGPIKSGDKFGSISLIYEKGILEAYDAKAEKVLHTVVVKMVPR